MRNINFMELVFAGEYISVILILFVSTWKDGFLSIKKEIRTQTFLYRLIPVILCTVIGISVMAGSYFLPLEENRRYWLNLWIQFVMVVINYTILGASLFQRYGVYPRGRELATVIVALYSITDLFVPWAVTKYVLLAAAVIGGVLLPDKWRK